MGVSNTADRKYVIRSLKKKYQGPASRLKLDVMSYMHEFDELVASVYTAFEKVSFCTSIHGFVTLKEVMKLAMKEKWTISPTSPRSRNISAVEQGRTLNQSIVLQML